MGAGSTERPSVRRKVESEDAEPLGQDSSTGAKLRRRFEARLPRSARIVGPILDIVPRYRQDDLGTHAGAITYGAFLSIPPLLVLGFSLAGYLIRDLDRQQDVIKAVVDLVPGLEGVVGPSVQRIVDGRLQLGLLGLAGVAWTASGVVARLRHALGVVHRTTYAGLLTGRFDALLLGIPLGAGFLLVVAASATVSGLGQSGELSPLRELGAQAIVVAVAIAFMAVFYRSLTPQPTARSGRTGTRLPDHVPAAVVFALGFAALQRLGAVYVDHVVARSSALYGTLGAIFGLLAFLYLAAYLFLLAAELSQVLHVRRLGFDLPPVVMGAVPPEDQGSPQARG